MLLESNTIKVIELIKYVDDLKNIDKVRLAIHILENKNFTTEYDINNIIILLKDILNQLDPNYSKVITNFAKYKNLLLLSSKYMELSYLEKKKFSIELLFNLYESDFKNETINKQINEHLDIYDYCYSLNLITE